jgi:hypothetical protein
MKVKAETTPERSYVYFMRMMDMELYIDISVKYFWLQERSILAKFMIMTP